MVARSTQREAASHPRKGRAGRGEDWLRALEREIRRRSKGARSELEGIKGMNDYRAAGPGASLVTGCAPHHWIEAI
jgi:hypothetical protein